MDFDHKVNKYKNEVDMDINAEILEKKKELIDLLDDYIISDVCNIVWDYCNEYIKINHIFHGSDGDFYSYGYMINLKNHGKWIHLFSNGNKNMEIKYINGVQNGAFKIWNSNGAIFLEGQCINGSYTIFPHKLT